MTLPTESANVSGWCLYLIECRDGSYYAGITNDLDARYQAHVQIFGDRPAQAPVTDDDPADLLAFQMRCDSAPGGFDFR